MVNFNFFLIFGKRKSNYATYSPLIAFFCTGQCHQILCATSCYSGGIFSILFIGLIRGFTHAEHKAGFDVTFPYYFYKNFKGGYQDVEFECKNLTMRRLAHPYLKKQYYPSHTITWQQHLAGGSICGQTCLLSFAHGFGSSG